MSRRRDLTGIRFGKLIAIESVGSDQKGKRIWKCKCDCGNFTSVLMGNLTQGKIISCGCAHADEGKLRRKNIARMRFGKLTAIKDVGVENNRRRRWLCKCDCGNEKIIQAASLLSGNTTSCGCSKESNERIRVDITGQRFGKLVALRDSGVSNGHNRMWICRCDCGNYATVRSSYLTKNRTKSCGCWKSECNSKERSHLWRGGKSFEPYCPAFSRKLKEDIRDAFGRQCFLCGAPENGKHLDVHHVDYNKSQGCHGHKWALIPLCHSCHMKTSVQRFHYYHMLRDYWIYMHVNFNSEFSI